MTLTDLMPSLRRSVPDPLTAERWPAGTAATTTDVLVGGVSLLHLSMLCGSPCVHTADASMLGPDARRPRPGVSVVVTTAVAVGVGPRGDLLVEIDADLARARPRWTEARLVGRASTARAVDVGVACGPGSAGAAGAGEVTLRLPGDLRPGDLLAVPCDATPALRDVRRADLVRAGHVPAPREAGAHGSVVPEPLARASAARASVVGEVVACGVTAGGRR